MNWLRRDLLAIAEAFGASGIATMVAAWFTSRVSGGKKQDKAEPNGARSRLQDEVYWLRSQLAKRDDD